MVIKLYNKQIPKVDSNHTCLAVINWDSALNKNGNCVFIRKCF